MRRFAPLALLGSALAIVALSATGADAQSPTNSQNLLPNGGFEEGDTGWAPVAGGALTTVDQPVQSGDSAGKVTASAPGRVTLATLRVQVAPGAAHTLRVSLRSDPPDDPDGPAVLRMEVSLEFFNTDGAPVGAPSTQPIGAPSDSWEAVEVASVEAPTDAAHARLVVTAEVSGSGAVFYVDSAKLTAGPAPAPPTPTEEPTAAPTTVAEPTFFASLTNGEFELPGAQPYGWRAHAGEALVTSEGGSRAVALTSRGRTTAWLHQSVTVQGGRWYEASGLLRPVSNAALARIRIAWYASEDASGAQLSTDDSDELGGVGDSYTAVSTGPIRAPDNARSAQLRVMLRPAGDGPAVLHADDVSLERTAPPPAAPAARAPVSVPTPQAMPTFFVALTNGDFELPGDTPYGWRARAGAVLVASDAGSRVAILTSRGSSTAWLHQSFAVEGGRWYEAGGRLRAVSNAAIARIRVAWYASDDASGAQLSTDDSAELVGVADAFTPVSTGAIRAPAEARSAELRVMLRPASTAPAVLRADDVSFTRIAPPPPDVTPEAPATPPLRPPAPTPSFFAALINGDFELPGETPYGWRAHAGAALVTSEGGSRAVAFTSRSDTTAWLRQSFAVEGGRWYQAAARLRPGANAGLARLRIAWYASEDASGPQLSVADSDEVEGASDSFATVSTGAIRAPDEARSAQLRIMLVPAAERSATIYADDVSFARTAPPSPATPDTPPRTVAPASEETPSFFASLTNGDFELPGEKPYGWRAHAGAALVTSEGGSRAVALTSRSSTTAWLHQSFAVEGGSWYEAGGRLRLVSDALLARIRVAWYASEDASGPQLSVADSDALEGAGESFVAVSTGAIRAPDEARSAQLRIMLRPAGEAPAVLHADNVSFAPTAAPPPPATPDKPPESASPAPEETPSFFASLTNGDFELPGETPYGWRAHAGAALVASESGSRAVALTSRGDTTAWLHQSFGVEGGRWYEAGGRLRLASDATLTRIRVAWYASGDASGPQLSVADSDALEGAGESFVAVSTGAIRAPDEARSAQLRIMLRPAGEAPAVLHADDVSFAPTAAPPPPAPGTASPPPEPAAPAAPSPAAATAETSAPLEPYGVRSASAVLLRITELLPDPLQSGSDAEYEWVEVANVGAVAVPLAGLILADNHGRIALPTLTLPPGGAIVVAGPRAEIGDAIALRQGSGLFNGLGNSGDRLALATEAGAIIDALSYGSDDSVDAPPLKAPSTGRSLQRRFDPAGRLIGAAVAEQPSPGRIEAPAAPDAVAAVEPDAPSVAAPDAADAGAYRPPSSVESLRKQLDDAANADRTAWIVLVGIAAVALAAAGAHRARELLHAAPPAPGRAPPRRERRWRRYASGEQVRRRALSPRRPRRTPRA